MLKLGVTEFLSDKESLERGVGPHVNVGCDSVGMLLHMRVRTRVDASAYRGSLAHQLVASAQRSDDGEVRWRRDEEKAEMNENLTESALRCQVNSHSHVVEDNEGDKRRCDLKTVDHRVRKTCGGTKGSALQ